MSELPLIGVMPPQTFLDEFLKTSVAASPCADFSDVPLAGSVRGMCETVIRVVEKYRVCPGLRLFSTKLKKRSICELPAQRDSSSSSSGWVGWSPHNAPVPIDSNAEEGDKDDYDLCPPLAARRRPAPRRGAKRKRRAVAEYYDFSTALLGIEVHDSAAADPFVDPPERVLPRRLSAPLPQRRDKPPTSARGKHSSSPTRRSATPHKQPDPEAYDSFDNDSEEGTAARMSLVLHARAQFARQYRTHLFQVVITHRFARFLRWDRAGAIVTEAFDYVSKPQLLADFLWRFSVSSDQQRGWDPTVELANKKEVASFRDAVQTFVRDMERGSQDDGSPVRRIPFVERSLDDTGTYPVWKIHVDNEATGDSTSLIVNRPFAGQHGLTGRATRAYIAYDVSQGRLVFMKDSWRDTIPALRPEFQTYQELRQHAVPFTPNVLYGGDVRNGDGWLHETTTHVYNTRENKWLFIDRELEHLVQHRIVQDIAFPLDAVANVREFIQALHDVLCAMDKAYNSAGLLHRDISKRNIMLTAEGRGVLNDWDHAGHKEHLFPGIGTWSFMSVELATNPDKLHDILDDLESLFWNLVFGALRRFPLPQERMSMYMFRERSLDEHGRAVGGSAKASFLLGRGYMGLHLASKKLTKLIEQCGACWSKCLHALQPLTGMPEDIQDEMRKILNDAKEPSYWAAMFADILKDMPPEGDEVWPSPTSSSESGSSRAGSEAVEQPSVRPQSAGRKRKALDAECAVSSTEGPRRSKRLRYRA